MSEDDNSKPYKVGRGKPPIEHQFKGTGNPRGRPRKPVRALTERQPVFDIIRVAAQPVRVRRGGKVTTTTIIESIWESIAAKAASGHGPSQRFFVKEYKTALQYLRKTYPKFLGTIDKFENAAGEGCGIVTQEDRERRDYLRRRTLQLVDAYDERKDPYQKKLKREMEAAVARRADRQARGIKAADVSVEDAGIFVEDSVDGRRLLVERSSLAVLARALGSRRRISAESLQEDLEIRGHSYNEAVAVFEERSVPFMVIEEPASRDETAA